MTQEEIIRMAREAGFDCLLPSEHIDDTGGVYVGDDDISGTLERFANLVASAEREACAAICDRIARRYGECPDVEPWAQGFKEGASVSAAKIRARGE